MKKNLIYYLIALTISITSCTNDSEIETEQTSSSNDIISFEFKAFNNSNLKQDYSSEINNNKISLILPFETELTNLIADFQTTADKVEINGKTQISGQTPNDFSNIITYTAIAENGKTKTYNVIVEYEKLSEITAQSNGNINSIYSTSYNSEENGWGVNLTGTVTKHYNAIDIFDNNVYVVGEKGGLYIGSIAENKIDRYTLDINVDNIDVKKTSDFLYILTENDFLRSSNNGQNFEKLKYIDFPINQLNISSNGNLYVISDGKLWRSTNNGSSFLAINSELPFSYVAKKGLFIDINNNLWVISDGKIYFSQDGGFNFSQYNTTSLTSDYNLIFVSPDNNVWVGNYNGILGKSINTGESFTFLDLTDVYSLATNISDIKFSSNSLWIAVGNGNSGLVKVDYNSTNLSGVYKGTFGTGINNDLAIDKNENIWSAESSAIGRNLQDLFK